MTTEQFVFWLQGFLKGMNFGNEKVALAKILEEELKKVNFISKQELPKLTMAPMTMPFPIT